MLSGFEGSIGPYSHNYIKFAGCRPVLNMCLATYSRIQPSLVYLLTLFPVDKSITADCNYMYNPRTLIE